MLSDSFFLGERLYHIYSDKTQSQTQISSRHSLPPRHKCSQIKTQNRKQKIEYKIWEKTNQSTHASDGKREKSWLRFFYLTTFRDHNSNLDLVDFLLVCFSPCQASQNWWNLRTCFLGKMKGVSFYIDMVRLPKTEFTQLFLNTFSF